MDGFHFYTSTGGAGASGFSDFFETLFGGGSPLGGSQDARRTGPGAARILKAKLNLLWRKHTGAGKISAVHHQGSLPGCGGSGIQNNAFCRRCGGTGETSGFRTLSVKIPPGVRDGSRIRLKGQVVKAPAAGPGETSTCG
jgi:curved DNA-binding protein